MSNRTSARTEPESEASERDHLADVEDGCGCVEVWEALSERRSQRSDDG